MLNLQGFSGTACRFLHAVPICDMFHQIFLLIIAKNIGKKTKKLLQAGKLIFLMYYVFLTFFL